MNKSTKILLAIFGACSVLIEIMTPLAVTILWGLYFNLSNFASQVVLVIGGLATLFRAIKIGGWIEK